MKPTPEGDRTTAIAVSVLHQSCAIPAAWRIHHATRRRSWTEPAEELPQAPAPAVPEEMSVVALCDRGIASPQLRRQIRSQRPPRT